MTRDRWSLAPVSRRLVRCGSCGHTVPAGAPFRTLSSGGVRCADCTLLLLGEEPPPLTPPTPPVAPTTQPTAQALDFEPPDFKRRSGGDDE